MFTDILRHLVNETIVYLERVRGDSVDFHLKFEDGKYKAKFDYGRIGEGDINTAVCTAIANALMAVDEDGLIK